MTYKEAMNKLYSERMKDEFSCKTQPKVHMPIKTNCERVQPYVAGVTPGGEIIWHGLEMQRWQMEMFRRPVQMFAEFFTRWMEVFSLERYDREFNPEDSFLVNHKAKSKKELAEMRRMYPKMHHA